jgi:hypothetical protein
MAMPQPRATLAADADDGEEQRRRQDQPAQGSQRRCGDGSAVAVLADGHLACDLQSDEQEEQRHQQVVHPVPQRLGQSGVAQLQGQRRLPEALVAAGPRAVRPEQREHRREQQQHRAAGLVVRVLPRGGGHRWRLRSQFGSAVGRGAHGVAARSTASSS